jgi:pilus assembly protein FimV
MEEPLYLAAAGAIVVLGGIGFFFARKRRAAERDWPDVDDDAADKIAPTLGGDAVPDEPARADLAEPARPVVPRAPAERPRPAPAEATAGIVAALAGARTESTGEDNDLDFHGTSDRSGAGERPREQPAQTQTAPSEPQSAAAARVAVPQERTAQPAPPRLAEPVPSAKPAAGGVPDFLLNPQSGTPTNEAPAPQVSASAWKTEDAAAPVPKIEMPSAPAQVEQSSAPAQKVDFDLEPLPTINTQAPSARTRPNVDFKLDLDDLDLNAPGQRTSGDAARDDHWHDVQQKFDLAKAYEDMGDKQGARDILQEVIREGDTAQQVQARRRLESLS